MTTRPTVLFVCVHNAGRSQMAAGFLRALSRGSVDVLSAGSMPGDHVNPVAVQAMAEVGIDIAGAQPRKLSDDAVQASDVVITMGCGDACPYYPGKRYEDWELTDPAGKGIETVREVRDEIRARVEELIASLSADTEPPVVVIGAGPAGLAAAANLRERGLPVIVLEAGQVAGAAVREWAHVRLFSPWSELIDPQAAKLLAGTGWAVPDAARYPTGGEWAADYLQPLADALGAVEYGHLVTGVAKRGRDLMVDSGRDSETFTVHVTTATGERRIEARAVIDASGTWSGANPLGGDGLPAVGEERYADKIAYRVPDLVDPRATARYAGKHIAIAGTGASGKTALIAFTKLAEEHPGTRLSWLVRRPTVGTAFGGGENDELPERGVLGDQAKAAVEHGPISTVTGFRTAMVEPDGDDQVRLTSIDGQVLSGVDEIVVLTGFRPDLTMLSEIRLDLDPVLQAPRQLAPLIDPNVHSCGTVYPHGAKELAQPEVGFYLVGMKSYGRATSFLALTGFEQARSVVAEVAGDHQAAARVELVLPESGVCGGSGVFDEPEAVGGGCCGAPSS